ncbi:MAG: hypothetical protein IJ486_10975 [Firmicutes bacterium]|nr:hypothetical protein [Bacillota bacterium]
MNRRWIAMGMALWMAVPVPVFGAESGLVRQTDFFEDVERPIVDFVDMDCQVRDVREIESDMILLRRLAKNSANTEKVKAEYEKLLKEYRHYRGVESILKIKYYKEPTNDDVTFEYRQIQESGDELDDLFGILTRDLLESPCDSGIRELLSEEDVEAYEQYREYEPVKIMIVPGYSEDVYKRERDLISFYTTDLLPGLESGEYKHSFLMHSYISLWETRRAIADANGYDNYAEYAYEVMYGRDYGPDELSEYFREVKMYLCPLRDDVYELADFYYERNKDVFHDEYAGERALDMLEDYFSMMSGELLESLTYMREHGLYDTEPDQTKSPIGITGYIEDYYVPFFFDSPYENLTDFFTAAHEMGHYNDYYWMDPGSMTLEDNLDVAEVHSQALELLMTEYYEELFGEASDYVFFEQLASILNALCKGAMLGELENRVYRSGDLSADKVTEIYCQLMIEYGYAEEGTLPNEMTDWVEISHLYQDPCYCISYSVSAAAALEFWMEAQKNHLATVDKYLEFVSLDFVPFRDALEEVGLQSPFEQYQLRYLSRDLRKELELDRKVHEIRIENLMYETVMGGFDAVTTVATKGLLAEPVHKVMDLCMGQCEELLDSALNH